MWQALQGMSRNFFCSGSLFGGAQWGRHCRAGIFSRFFWKWRLLRKTQGSLPFTQKKPLCRHGKGAQSTQLSLRSRLFLFEIEEDEETRAN